MAKIALPGYLLCLFWGIQPIVAIAQNASIRGKVISEGKPIEFASISLPATLFGTSTDTSGNYLIKNLPATLYKIHVSCIGYESIEKTITLKPGETVTINFNLTSDKTTLNEIVVTGVSRATLLKESPVSIVSISTKTIEQTSESNIIDVLAKNIPGLTAMKTGPNISKPFIRGLGYNKVLTLYDGIRQEGQQWGHEHGVEVDPYNLEKAEVIKGPSSLMYGSDALAGVVSFIPFIPTETDGKIHGKTISEYQTNNNLFGNGLRLDISGKHWSAAMRGSFRIAKNYRDAVDGRVFNTNFNEKNLSALIGYKSKRGYSNFNFTLYDNLQGIPDGSRDSLTRKFTYQVYEGVHDDIKNRPVVPGEQLNSYDLAPLHQHIQHYRVYTKDFYTIGKSDIEFLLAFQQNIRREYDHPTAPQQAGMFVRLNTINYGIKYNLPKFSNIEPTIGLNGMVQNNKSKNATDFPIPNYNLFDAGMYLHLKWKHNNWTISGGIRYDIRKINWSDFFVRTDSVTGFDKQARFSDTVHSTLQFPGYKKIFGGISASIGFTYEINKKISIKVNAARGYRAPNITELASNGLDPGAHIIYLGNRNFNPEFSLQVDVGGIVNFKNISTTISIFNNTIQDYIYLSQQVDANNNPIIDAQGNRTYQYEQASAQLYGMEATVSIHPEKLKGFSFDNSMAMIYGYNKKREYKNKNIYGEYLSLIPPMKVLSSITQRIETKSRIFTAIIPKLEVEFDAAQNRYLALNNTETFTPAYTLFDIGIVDEISYSKNKTAQFQLQINNLFDEIYQSNLSRLKYFEYYSQSPDGRLGIYNMGRNICIKIIFPF